MIELKYKQVSDYLIPELILTEEEQRPLGKYGLMRKTYLKEYRPVLYTRLLLNGTLMPHLQEIETTANMRMTILMPQLMKQNGVTEKMKAEDQMMWLRRMNNLCHQAEEIILAELIYN